MVTLSTTKKTKSLRNLESLEINECNNLYHIFNVKRLDIGKDEGDFLSKLRQLHLRNLRNFTSITGGSRRMLNLNLKMLTQLTVCNCDQLKYLLPHYVLENLEQLQNIDVSDCPMLEQVFLYEENAETTELKKPMLPLLHSLELTNLPKLDSICYGVLHLLLNQMTIDGCPRLTSSFAHSQNASMTNSQEVHKS